MEFLRIFDINYPNFLTQIPIFDNQLKIMTQKPVEGFSKLTKQGKIDWIVNEYLEGNEEFQQILKQYWNDNPELQKLHDEFSENTICLIWKVQDWFAINWVF